MVQAQANRCKFTSRIILVHAPIRHCTVFYNFFIMENNGKSSTAELSTKAATFAGICSAAFAILAVLAIVILGHFVPRIGELSIGEIVMFVLIFIYIIPSIIYFVVYKRKYKILSRKV